MPKLTWATDVADRQITQMTRLIDELLDVARISQGKIALQSERLDLRNVLAHGIETVRPFIDARMHVLSQRLPHGARCGSRATSRGCRRWWPTCCTTPPSTRRKAAASS